MALLEACKSNQKVKQVLEFAKAQLSSPNEDIKEPPSQLHKKDLLAAVLLLYSGEVELLKKTTDSSQKETQEQANKLCKEHKFKTCQTKDCPMEHPEKCELIMKHGIIKFDNAGCDLKCGKFHPRVCHTSMKFKTCYRKSCKQMHLPGTQRKRKPNYNSGYSGWDQNQNYWYPAAYSQQWNQPYQNFNYQGSFNNQGNSNFQSNRSQREKGSINNARNNPNQELVQGFQELQKSLQILIQQMPNQNQNNTISQS